MHDIFDTQQGKVRLGALKPVEHFSFRLITRLFPFVLLLQEPKGLHGLLQGQLYFFLLAGSSGMHRNGYVNAQGLHLWRMGDTFPLV
jgi:hypothetical protein